MKDHGEWIQIVLFLIFAGLAVARVVIAKFWNKMQDNEPSPQKPKSPAIQMLERMRAENEQAAAVMEEAPTPGARAGHLTEVVYDDGSDDEDAFFGDDGLAGQRAMRTDAAGRRRPPRAPGADRPAGARSLLRNQHIPGGEDVGASRPRRPAPARGPGQLRSVEFGEIDLSASHPRSPREQVLHPGTETAGRAVASPRAADEHIEVYGEMNLADAAADLGMSQLPQAPESVSRVPLQTLLSREGMTLRQALIGQIIFGPPKSRGG